MLPSITSIQNNFNPIIQQSGSPQTELHVDTLVFHCRRVKNSEELRQLLPLLIKLFPQLSGKEVRHFQEEIVDHLLKFSQIEEQQELSLLLANWYTKNQSSETKLFGSLQAMHYFAKAIQMGNSRNDPLVKEIHRQASQLFLALIDEQHLEKMKKSLSALTNVTSEDLHAVEIFEHHIDQFHLLTYFCTELKDFDLIHSLFRFAIKALNAVPLNRLEKYDSSSEKIDRGLKLIRTLPKQYITEKYWDALAAYRSVFNTMDFTKKLTVEEIRRFQRKTTESFQAFFKMLIDDALILLGPPPSTYQKRLHQPPCQFEILAMGSLSRGEICPYSDLEFMILIENVESSDYFKKLVQILEIQMASLGETSTDNPVFTCIHIKNPSGFHIDSSPSLNSKLIQTPSNMVDLQANPTQEFQTIEYTALRATSVYTSGSTQSLFESYQTALKESLKSCREERAFEFFTWHYADYQKNWKQPFNPYLDIVDVKKQFVVPLYHLLGDMALYYSISATNTLDCIDALEQRECFTRESAELLQECVASLYAMRIRFHLDYEEQKEEASCSSNLQFLKLTEKEIASLKKTYWLVLQPLYGCLGSILKKLTTSETRASDFKTLFRNIDLIPIAFQDNFFHLSESLVQQIGLHYCQTNVLAETHLYYFRALSKHSQESLRECYFTMLEEHLPLADKADFLRILLDIPNQSGLRLAFNRELKELEAAFHGTTDKFPDGNETVAITTPSSPIPRYLKIPLIEELLECSDIRKMYPGSAHEVCQLDYDGYDFHFKQKPSHPLMEYAIHNLTSRIAGNITPPVFLVRFDVYRATQGKKSYPVLVSKTIAGKNLSEEWRKVKPNASYTWNLLCSILTRPGDGRFENYIVDDQFNLFCVDNDCAFVELVSKAFFSKVQFCAAPFSILHLDTPLDPAVLKEFASLDSYAIILGWIEDVILKEKEYKALFTKEQTERLFTEDKDNSFTPSILFQKGALANLHLQFWSLQNAIRLAFDKEQMITSGFLLKELIDLANDSIGAIIHQGYGKQPYLPDAKERLKRATSRTSGKSLTSVQYYDSLGIKPTIIKIEKGDYSPENAKEEFLATVLKSESRYATVKENQKEITIEAPLKRLNNDPIREEKVLQALTQKFKRMPKEVSITLIFNDSHIMTSGFLAPFLHKNVEHIELTNCPTIENDTITLIQEKCPQLKRLSLKGCANITEIRGSYWSPVLGFTKLEELDVSDCRNLQSLKLDAPSLKILKFENTPILKNVENTHTLLVAIKKDARAFQYANENFKKDRAFNLKAIDRNSRVIPLVNQKLWSDKTFVLDTMKINIQGMEYANESFKKDREFVLRAVSVDGKALQYADGSLKKDREFVLAAVKINASALDYVDENLKMDKEFVLAAVNQNGGALNYADENLKKDKEFVLAAIKQNGRALEFVDASFKKDKGFLLAAVKENDGALQFADKSLQKDKEFVLAAVKNNGFALRFADESFKKDKEFVLAVVKENRLTLLQFADKSLMKDKEFVLAAVKQNGTVLGYADASLRKDKEFVLAAVKENGFALPFAEEHLKKDKEVVLAAVKENGGALQFADESLMKDKEIVLAAVKQNGWALHAADASLKKDKEVVLTAVKQNGWALHFADESLKKDKEVVLAAVKENGFTLQFADESLKEDKEVVLDAVKQNGGALHFADASLKKDKEVVLAAVKQNGWALHAADASLKKDKEVVLAAVKQDGFALRFADESLKEDKEVVLDAVKQNGGALHFADASLKKDKEVVLAAFKQIGTALEYADASLKTDKEFVLAAVKQDGFALHSADENLKKDKEVVLAAVKENGFVLEFADESLMKDKEVVLAAVKRDGFALEFADESLKKDKEVVLAAVKQNGGGLEYVDASLKKDKEVVQAAVKENGFALQFADESLKKDKVVVLAAVKQNGWALHFADASLKKDKEVVLAAVKENGFTLQFADESLKEDKEVVLATVKQDGLELQFADESLKEDKEVVLAAVKQNGYALEFAHNNIKDVVIKEMTEMMEKSTRAFI
jgi:predicted RNA-binding protein (virulence factor B family)